MQLPRTRRIDGNRFDRRGQVIADRRRYFDWGEAYEPDVTPLRPARRISPAKREYRAERQGRRKPRAA